MVTLAIVQTMLSVLMLTTCVILASQVIQIHAECSETKFCRQCSCCCCLDCNTYAKTTSMLLQISSCLQVCSVSLVVFPTLRRATAVPPLRYQHRQPARRCTHHVTMPASAQQTFFLDEFAHKQFNDVNPDTVARVYTLTRRTLLRGFSNTTMTAASSLEATPHFASIFSFRISLGPG